ncbi:hypothetical protein LCGC14_0687440 [marine sediment metagenome]|uniref:LamG-like jellyroll fold domain-containing protein n=1 Tax=marine sediment metagenome TaxID=412755 RepID=A0A0F9TUE0_9ZZZZ
MKKLFILMFCIILLVGTVNAFEWDNKLIYSEDDLKVTIKNSILKIIPTSQIGMAELKSHNSVDEILKVGFGREEVVMYYDFKDWKKYKNGLGEVYFTNLTNGENIEKDYYFVEWVSSIEIRHIYDDIKIGQEENGTAIYEKKIIQTYEEEVWDWKRLENRDIPNRNTRIGLKTFVNEGDYIDAEWTIAGEKIKKHAGWEASWETDMISYFNYEQTSGDLEDVHDGNDGTNVNGTTQTATGQISNAWDFEKDNENFVNLGNAFTFTDSMTISTWVNLESLVGNMDFVSKYTGGDFIFFVASDDGGTVLFFIDDDTGLISTSFIETGLVGGWNHIVAVANGTHISLYHNGTFKSSTAQTGNIDITSNNVNLGRRPDGSNYYDGLQDETFISNRSFSDAEVLALYTAQKDGFVNGTYPILQAPIITLNFPTEDFKSTSQTINFNGTVTSPIGVTNVSLFVDGILNETNSSGINDTNYLFTKLITDGNHNWTYESCNSGGCRTATTRDFLIDTSFPQIDISDPIDATSYIYLIYNDTFNLNATVTDANLDTCFYEYNSTNTSYSCSTGIQQNETFNIMNQSDISIWANDTSGNLNHSSVSWNVGLFDFNNYTYDLTITETSQTNIIGNFQTNTSITSAYLEYNNTNHSASIDSLGGNVYVLSRTVTSPAVPTDTNISWNFWANDINSTLFNQTVFNIQLDNCSTHSNVTIYYYLEDELDQTLIDNENSTIESLVILKTLLGENVAQFNQVFEGNSTPQVCSELNLTNSNLRIWEQSRYGSDDYVFEQHNIQNASMITFANFTLLDLPSTSATTFRIIYKSETFLPVTDAIINVQRKYIGEGIFKSIESPITDANGEVSASLDLDAVIYRIIVRQNGTTLSTFENPAIACQNILTGDCTININERQTINLINNFDSINDFNYGLTQDNRTITLTFEIPSGISKSVNLFVNQSTILGNQTSCNQTTFATSGQMQCVIDPTLGDVFATADVSSDGTLITTASTTILEDRRQYFGTDNIVLTFFLVLSLILLMVSDPIAVLIGIVIGLITSGLMLFLNVGSLFGVTSILMYLIIIVIILIIKISNRQR